MVELSREDVMEIARLARLELSAQEIEGLRGQLSAILVHMDALRSLDTDGIEPLTHAVPMQLRLRTDEARDSLPVATALSQTPERADDYFQVPSIIGGTGE